MNEDFRKRAFTPIVLPLGLTGGIALFAWSLSRVFLALPGLAATFVALLVAGYVLAIGAVVSRMRDVTSRSLAVGLALGMIGVVGAGAVANAIGPREFHPPEVAADEEEPEDPGDEEPDVDIPDDAVVFTSVDNEFTEAPDTVPSGTITVALVNEGNSEHNVHIEETDERIVEASPDEVATAEAEFDAGETYSYYCDIPGHQQTMSGEFTVEE